MSGTLPIRSRKWLALAALALSGATVILVAGQGSAQPAGNGGQPAMQPQSAPATQSAATTATAPASRPASQSRPGGRAGRRTREEPPPFMADELIRTARQSFVIVRYSFRRDTSEESAPGEQDRYSFHDDQADQRALERLIDRKMTMDMPGLVIAPDEVLVTDARIEPRFVSAIQVQTLDGRTFAAQEDSLIARCGARVLKVSAAPAALVPVRFAPMGEVTTRTPLAGVILSEVDDQWELTPGSDLCPGIVVSGGDRLLIFGSPCGQTSGGALYSGSGSGPMLIVDDQDRPVGAVCGWGFDSRQAYGLWRGADLLSAPRTPLADLERQKRAVRERLCGSVHEVLVQFRQGGSEGEGPSFGGGYGGYGGRESYDSSDLAGREITGFGVAVDPTHIFIPQYLDRKIAAQIDRVTVKLSPTRRVEARFVGAFRDFGGCLIEVPAGSLPAVIQTSDQLPPRGEILWLGAPCKRFADKYVDLKYLRLYGKERGYANRYYWQADRSLDSGDLLLDYEGRLVGVVMRQRTEDEEQRQAADSGDRSSYGSGGDERIFLMEELRAALANPAGHLDEKITVKGRLAARRRPWFGVEFVTLSAEVAEQMKVSKPTRDGAVGLLVNAVYEGSPAAKGGVQAGDILLGLTVAGKGEPVEFKADRDDHHRYSGMWGDFGGGSEDEGEGPLEPTWKSRDNFLTNLLDAIGLGTEVTIRYWRAGDDGVGEAKEATFRIELAPPDFDSARRWKNRGVGLTVKDLTYEIRKALSLAADAPGVVIARIEPGSPAAVARVWPNEIITHADGKPLTSAAELQQIIAAAHKAGRDKVRLAVLRLGKSRFADLKIDAYSAQDDEGLNEDESAATTSGPTTTADHE